MNGDNLHDDIKAAFDQASSDAPPSATPPAPNTSQVGSPPAETLPPVLPDQPSSAPRNPDGTFAPKAPGSAAAPAPGAPLGSPATPVAGAAPTPAPGAPGAVPGAPATPGTPPVGEVRLDPSKPPAGWTPTMKEKWMTLPEEARAEITRREEANAQGVAKLQKQYEPAVQLYNAVAQYGDYFQHTQQDPLQYINSMIGVEQTLNLGNPAQKIEMLLALADQYGVPMRKTLDAAMNGGLNNLLQQAHQHHKTPNPIPPQVQQELQYLRQQQEYIVQTAADSELDQFVAAGDKPFFDNVRNDMADLIESGVVDTYQDAYDLAVWRDPAIRQQAMAQQNGQSQLTGVQARQQAAAQISTPPSANIAPVQAGTADGDVFDDVRAAFAKAASGGV